jgi:hypothetical protein
MAKVEFIKETSINGQSVYYTELDGMYINNTSSLNYEEARQKYLAVTQGKTQEKQVLETTEVDLNIL